MKQPFDAFPYEVRKFYANVFNNAVINLYAVQRGYFDKLISDMDDFYNIQEWYDAYPKMIMRIQEDNERNKDIKD